MRDLEMRLKRLGIIGALRREAGCLCPRTCQEPKRRACIPVYLGRIEMQQFTARLARQSLQHSKDEAAAKLNRQAQHVFELERQRSGWPVASISAFVSERSADYAAHQDSLILANRVPGLYCFLNRGLGVFGVPRQ